MGLFSFLSRCFGGARKSSQEDRICAAADDEGHGLEELSRRMGMDLDELSSIPMAYDEFRIPKKSGGARLIQAPIHQLKTVQRKVNRVILQRLRAHPAAKGFEKNQSVVSNALPHVGKDVVVRMDLKDFFPSTPAKRVLAYFIRIGWNKDAAGLLTMLTTHQGALPQGAPTSPRLSNLVNFNLDARMTGLAKTFEADYTRYADDLTFSFNEKEPGLAGVIISSAKAILSDFSYTLHQRKKLFIRRKHQQQLVTGIVVNSKPNLPRKVRRMLRAVEHRIKQGKKATLSPQEYNGWKAYHSMVENQTSHP